MVSETKIPIPARIHNAAVGGHVAGTEDIIDDALDKEQSEINQEVVGEDATSIKNRLNSIEAVFETSGGDAEITSSPTDIIVGGGKIPTANAVRGAITAANGYFVCDSLGTSYMKNITVPGYIVSTGGSIKIKMTNANTAETSAQNTITLQINNFEAKPLYYDGELVSATNTWDDGETVDVYYDGTSYYANNTSGGGKFLTGEKVKEVGIDAEPTAGSRNLVESGGVFGSLYNGSVVPITSTASNIIIGADGKWKTASTYKSNTVNITPGCNYTIEADSSTSFCLLKTYNPVVGEMPDFATGYTANVGLEPNRATSFIAPNDANILTVNTRVSNVNVNVVITKYDSKFDTDTIPVEGSAKLITSGAVYDAVHLEVEVGITPRWLTASTHNDMSDIGTIDDNGDIIIPVAAIGSGRRIEFDIRELEVGKDYIVRFVWYKVESGVDVEHEIANPYYLTTTTGSTIRQEERITRNTGKTEIIVKRLDDSYNYVTFATASMDYISAGDTCKVKNFHVTYKDSIDNILNELAGEETTESVSPVGNSFGIDNNFTYFDKTIASASVNDSGTVVSGGKVLACKAVVSGDVLTYIGFPNVSGTIRIFMSDTMPSVGSTGLVMKLSRTFANAPQAAIEYIADSNGYAIIEFTPDSNITYCLYKKEDYSMSVKNCSYEPVVVKTTTTKRIDADPTSDTFGDAVAPGMSATFSVTDFIDVEDIAFLEFYYFYSAGNAFKNPSGGVFYNSEKEPVSVAYINNSFAKSVGHKTLLAIPNNVKYIRLTLYTSQTSIIKYKTSESNRGSDGLSGFREAVAQAKFVDSSTTIRSLGLLHFSDIHGDQEASDTINECLPEIQEYVDDVLCTGDSVEYYADGTTTYPNGATWWTDDSGLAEKSLFVIGNHEGTTVTTSDDPMKEGGGVIDGKGQAWDYDTFIAPYIETLGYVMPTGYDDSSSPYYKACYWHKDYAEQKIRVIGLDCIHRFDGVLNPSTGAIVSAGVRQESNAQELWLIDRLNETLANSGDDAEGYSVVIACHYPIDDFSGNNETWNDSSHKFVYNQNAAGGRVMNHKTEDATAFHYGLDTSYTAVKRHCMRNRVGTTTDYEKGSVNNIAAILAEFMESGGKFVAWLCGHTHVDYMWYSTNYPDILCIVLDQAGCRRGTNTGDRNSELSTRTCANFYSIDTQNGLFKIVRIGYDMNKLMNSHRYLCYDYINRKVLNEG